MKTFGIVQHKAALSWLGKKPDGIDAVLAAGDSVGLKRLLKICRSGDQVVPLNGMVLSRLTKLGFERKGVTVVDLSEVAAARRRSAES